jgi:hypothetical protein
MLVQYFDSIQYRGDDTCDTNTCKIHVTATCSTTICHATGRCSRIQHIGQKWKDYVDVKPDVKMPPVPKCSQIDSSWIQLEMIWYICADLGNDGLLKFANGSKQTGIRSIIKDAQEKYYPVSE